MIAPPDTWTTLILAIVVTLIVVGYRVGHHVSMPSVPNDVAMSLRRSSRQILLLIMFLSGYLGRWPEVATAQNSTQPSEHSTNGDVSPSAHSVGWQACRFCHPAETRAWAVSGHHDTLKSLTGGSADGYRKAMGLTKPAGRNTACVRCHGSPVGSAGGVQSVSCESCHGASGGRGGWLGIHAVFGHGVAAAKEDPKHRKSRLTDSQAAGMIRFDTLYGLARNCLSCHAVTDAELVNAGHKTGDKFDDLVAWSTGSIRHNLHENQRDNAEGPTIWARRTGGDVAGRRRIKFIVGLLADLEVTMQSVSTISDENDFLEKQIDERILARLDVLIELSDVHEEAEVELPGKLAAVLELFEQLELEDYRDSERYLNVEDREDLLEASKTIGSTVRWFATQNGRDFELFDELIGDPRGDVYQPK